MTGSSESAVASRQSPPLADADARRHATNPAENVVLEASAGTGRRACWSSATSTCCSPASIPTTSSRSRSRARPRPKCGSGSSPACARRRGLSQIDAGRWRDLRERLGDIAISTIDAFCLSLIREFPLEADVDPGFELADETEIPRLVDEALDSALRIGRHLAQGRRRRGDGVRAAGRAAAARRARGAARSPARRARRAAQLSGVRPARSDAGAGVPARRAAAARRAPRRPWRHPDVPRRRPARPSALCDAGGRSGAALRAGRRCIRDARAAGGVPHARRSHPRVLSDAGRQAAQGGRVRPKRIQEGSVPLRGGVEGAPRRRRSDRAGDHGGGEGVPPRPERDPVARRLADVPHRDRAVRPDARVARRPRLFGGAVARRRAAEADGGVLAQPLQARGAVSPRARRRVPGHEPRAVGARVAAREELGRRVRRRRRRAAAVDLRGRRPQAVDLRLPRRRVRGARRGRRLHRDAAPRGPAAARDFGELPRGAGAARVRERSVRRGRQDGRRSAAGRVPVRRSRSVSHRRRRPAKPI